MPAAKLKSSIARQKFYSRRTRDGDRKKKRERERERERVNDGKILKIVLHLAHSSSCALSSLRLRTRNILVVREPAALGVFCIIYLSVVHAHCNATQPASQSASLTWLTQITLIPLGELSYFMERVRLFLPFLLIGTIRATLIHTSFPKTTASFVILRDATRDVLRFASFRDFVDFVHAK